MTHPETTILLVGYGWFRGIPEGEINNAEAIARALDGEFLFAQDGSGAAGRIHSLIAPVTWDGAFAPVEAAALELRPQIILALGTDAASPAMRPEPYGVNWCEGRDARPDDPGAEAERSGELIPGGEPVLRGTLPFEAMTRAMLRAGIPAYMGSLQESEPGAPTEKCATTGLYLCNLMAYRLAHFAKTAPFPVRTGFMHVPNQPAYAAARRLRRLEAEPEALSRPIYASMTLAQMVEGVRVALGTCLSIIHFSAREAQTCSLEFKERMNAYER